eukprot:11526930-Alexandrium_andersonii.AAC.1
MKGPGRTSTCAELLAVCTAMLCPTAIAIASDSKAAVDRLARWIAHGPPEAGADDRGTPVFHRSLVNAPDGDFWHVCARILAGRTTHATAIHK